jgi:hypothetical protein
MQEINKTANLQSNEATSPKNRSQKRSRQMTIKYSLVKNHLTGNSDFRALVHHAGTVGMDAVVDDIIGQGSTVTRADILSVLEGYHTAIEKLLLQGFRVHTPLANYGISVRGVFEDEKFDFDPAFHRVVGTLTQGPRLRRTLTRRSQTARTDPRTTLPTLLLYLDVNSGERNSIVTPGGVGRLIGHRLKLDLADPAQGVYFVAEDGAETKVQVLVDNFPGKLTFVVPTGLASGSYTLEGRAAFAENKLHGGKLDAVLTV